MNTKLNGYQTKAINDLWFFAPVDALGNPLRPWTLSEHYHSELDALLAAQTWENLLERVNADVR